jgi:uncharacterized protein (DUF1330 family)
MGKRPCSVPLNLLRAFGVGYRGSGIGAYGCQQCGPRNSAEGMVEYRGGNHSSIGTSCGFGDLKQEQSTLPHNVQKRGRPRGDTVLAKGYWIAFVDVTDAEAYKAYVKANAVAFRKFGARFLMRGGKAETVEGQSRSRIVVLEFKDYETALACYRSPEYGTAMALRQNAALSDIAVVEGYDGPQP